MADAYSKPYADLFEYIGSLNTKGSEEPDCFVKFPAILDVVSLQTTAPYI